MNDATLRSEAMARLDCPTLYQRLIDNFARVPSGPFDDIMYQVHRKHEAVSASPRHIFNYREILHASGETG